MDLVCEFIISGSYFISLENYGWTSRVGTSRLTVLRNSTGARLAIVVDLAERAPRVRPDCRKWAIHFVL